MSGALRLVAHMLIVGGALIGAFAALFLIDGVIPVLKGDTRTLVMAGLAGIAALHVGIGAVLLLKARAG